MIAGVADTHTALRYLYDDARLSAAPGDFIDHPAAAGKQIVVSSISLAEIVYLIEKNRLPAKAYADLTGAIADPDHVLRRPLSRWRLWTPCLRSRAPTFRTCRTESWRRPGCILGRRSSAAMAASEHPA